MVELVNFDSDKFSSEFVQDEIISLGAVTVIENEGTTEVNSVGIEIRHREKRFGTLFSGHINMLAKEDCGLAEIRSLARSYTKT